jgi:hypothetical protein
MHKLLTSLLCWLTLTTIALAQGVVPNGVVQGSIMSTYNGGYNWIDPCSNGILAFNSAKQPYCTATPTIGGALPYTGTGIITSYVNNINSYTQVVNSNANAGAAASADFIVSNNLATDSTYYGDFGINSSGWIGTGGFNLASETYLYSNSGDLALGTNTANAIHFVINGSTTDSATIGTTGLFSTSVGIGIGSTPSLLVSATAPTFTSGACVGAIGTVTSTAAFTFTTGSGSCTNTAVLGMPTAATGWVCDAFDEAITGASYIKESADSTTSVTLTTYTVGSSPAAGPFTASHTVKVHCTAY